MELMDLRLSPTVANTGCGGIQPSTSRRLRTLGRFNGATLSLAPLRIVGSPTRGERVGVNLRWGSTWQESTCETMRR
jgi:hypothetical protein